MLERQPHTEIGRQAEHADDLRGADSFGTHHSSCCHAADATAARYPLPGTNSSASNTPSRPQARGRGGSPPGRVVGELSASADRGAAAFAREGGVSVESHDMLGKDEQRASRGAVGSRLLRWAKRQRRELITRACVRVNGRPPQGAARTRWCSSANWMAEQRRSATATRRPPRARRRAPRRRERRPRRPPPSRPGCRRRPPC